MGYPVNQGIFFFCPDTLYIYFIYERIEIVEDYFSSYGPGIYTFENRV